MPALVKLPVDPQRIRRLPRQFGAVDRNLIYGGHIRHLSPMEIGLYVVLICVADAQGLSYYSDRRLAEVLDASAAAIAAARDGLLRHGLILYRRPMYQLTELPA